ncbi:MAG: TRAM domain-containing protein, partial [Myxococcaceae bacterium]
TDEDFEKTIQLTELVRFEHQYSFVFSPRPKTGAALREDEWGAISHEVKIQRLERLQKLQRKICQELMATQVGLEVEVLVEGPSRSDPTRRFGRTPENRTVNFDGDAEAGAVVKVKVEHTSPNQHSGVQVGFTRTSVPLPTVATAPTQLVANS